MTIIAALQGLLGISIYFFIGVFIFSRNPKNQIGNAIKFCKARTPEVHVTAKQEENNWIFGIRDNGIGIKPGQSFSDLPTSS
ncbi:MAG: hypothetical protein A2293_01340 [Elusimicrobia bacterium RIFOXYB2_FULL_49_7]|nr:MAG: hypothetical protein A2293_01340 [Elusimicrobia bacterium RIFOXYB2_FULL_49_7]